MEELLLRRNEDHIKTKDKINVQQSILLADDVNAPFLEFVRALRKFRRSKTGPSPVDEIHDAAPTAAASHTNTSASWLLDQCSQIPSSQLMGGPLPLALSIHEACTKYKHKEAELQAALFELIGMESMEFLLELVQNAAIVANSIQPEDVKRIAGAADGAHAEVYINKEQERQRIREEALEALNLAAIAKAQADAITSRGSTGTSAATTHSVVRASDKELTKEAKRAAKRAAAALSAAREAGVIIEEHLTSSLDASTLQNEAENFGMQKGLAGMTDENLRAMKASLLPEGSKSYYESIGLPVGTKREFGDGYERVTIPPRVMDESKRRSRIKVSDVMNATARKAFEGTEYLNPMQSTVFEAAFLSQENLLICAPTGAGKTNVAMLTVVAHFRDKGIIKNDSEPYAAYQHIGAHGGQSNGLAPGRKVIYIAPMKALAQEVVEKFDSKLRPLKITVRELTGDMQLSRAEAASADIIVTTPEKWDVVTRKGGDGSLSQSCGVLIIDEVHLLADERGAVIESVVARLHRLVESTQQQVRIVGLSATLPNYRDVAQFLRVNEQRGLFYFGPEHRPVPLEQQFIGVSPASKDQYARDRKMNDLCYEVVSDSLRRGYQVMVFVHSRKGTGQTATALAEIAAKRGELESLFLTVGTESNGDAHGRYAERAAKSRNRELSLHFSNGMSVHHAGMLRPDRKLSEQMFADGAIKVLCCTATLAWGINLPAHTVVIKGTEVYNPEKGGNVDLSILDVQQIFGRAGRPQFDSFGEATLITSHDALARYLNLLVKDVPIESNFIKQLADHLNAEVVGGTVTNIREAAEWLTYTYLYVRMCRNPLLYGVTMDQKEDDPSLRGRCRELVHLSAKLLDEHRMLRYDERSGNLSQAELGRVASYFYIRTESVVTFNEMLERIESPSDKDLCHLVCCASEFENVKIRQDEMSEIDNLKKQCPLRVDVPVEEFSGKCCVLLQSFISNSKLSSFTLISDTNYISQNSGRVARALFEMCLRRGKASSALKLLRLAKSIDKRIWWFQSPLRQFPGEIQDRVFSILESKKVGEERGYDSLEAALSLLDMHPKEVGVLLHFARGGDKIQRLARMLPRFDVTCSVHPITNSILKFSVHLEPNFVWHSRWHGGALGFWLWIEDSENRRVYHHEYVLLSRRTHPEPADLEMNIPAFPPLPPQYYLRIVSDSWVGCESVTPISFKHLLLPEREMPFTDLLNLTPLPVSALQEPTYEKIYKARFESFNPIQTQLFHVLYHSNLNVLLGAPTSSGKTVVAELALMRLKRTRPRAKCVYIAPLKSLARERLKEWKSRFGPSSVNWKILELSGDTHHDTRTLNEADVLVCTPEKWDLITRGWRGVGDDMTNSPAVSGKKFVKEVGLLIIDEIHLLGEERGAVLEAIVSRTRLISRTVLVEDSNNESVARLPVGGLSSERDVTRIIGLSTALSNPRDLADWMGIDVVAENAISSKGLYNFRPSVRPIPMDVHIQGFPGRHYCPRMATMNKPAYAAIKEHSPSQPVLIFVSSRRQTRLTALDLISFAAADGNPSVFLGCDHDFIGSIAETVSDTSLKHTLLYGVAIHHAGLTSTDREIVESLFLNGSIQVLVATATLAWGVNLPAHLVIVKGTEYYDKSRYVDYPLTDVLQMIGRAGRPGFSERGVSVVMVAEEKKPFYKRFLYSPFPVESCLKTKMEENLNAEIAASTINSLSDGVGYLSWTYFFRRVKMNPSYYDAVSGDADDFESFFTDIVKGALTNLESHRCAALDRKYDNWGVATTVLGCAASSFYLNFKTPMQMGSSLREILSFIAEFSTNIMKAPCNVANGDDQDLKFAGFESSLVIRTLMALSWTHEFDELPVRHNEEELNASLSAALKLDSTTKRLLHEHMKERRSSENDEGHITDFDIMGDPHTKCYLLIQAHLSRTALPVSDYVNDTKSVIDQLPRLVGAMQFIAQSYLDNAGSFDVFCMLSKVKQVLKSRSSLEGDPLNQIPSIPREGVKRLRSRGVNFSELCKMDRLSAESVLQTVMPKKHQTGGVATAISFLRAVPIVVIDDTSMQFIEKTRGNGAGLCKINLSVSVIGSKRRVEAYGGINLFVALGCPSGRRLLAHKNVYVSCEKNCIKAIEMSFDWKLALSGADDEGKVLLRIVREDVRGLDLERRLNLP